MNVKLQWRLIKRKNKNSYKKSYIYLRIRDNDVGKESTINSDIEIDNKYWKGGYLSKKHPNYTNLVRLLGKMRDDVESIISEIKNEDKYPFPSLIKKRYKDLQKEKKNETVSFLSYDECWDKFLHQKKVETSFYTHRMYLQLYKRLNEFSKFKKITLTFEYLISTEFETEFKEWSWNVKNHKNSFVRKNLTSLKSFMNFCDSNQYIDIKIRNYKKPKVLDKQEVIFLKKEEVLKLFNTNKYDYVEGKVFRKEIVPVTDYNKFGTVIYYNNWELVIDLMLFMCISGCRWNDLHYLTWDSTNFDKETFTWENKKTNKFTTIPLDKIGISILKKYGKSKSRDMKIFPKYSGVHFNIQIKKIFKDLNLNRLVDVSKMMGVKTINTNKKRLYEVVSSHVGRRTFVMNLIDKGIDYKTIMTMTGHSDIKSLMKYVSVGEQSLESVRNMYVEKKNDDSELIRLYHQLEPSKQIVVMDLIKNLI